MDSVNYDRALSALAIILFSFALGTLSVVVPLLGVHAGYTPPVRSGCWSPWLPSHS